jgi:hypothetical protein
MNVHTYVHTGNNGDYENAQEDEDEEEEVEEGGAGGASDVNVLRAHSMGCTAEEAWKRYVLYSIPPHSALFQSSLVLPCHPQSLFVNLFLILAFSVCITSHEYFCSSIHIVT